MVLEILIAILLGVASGIFTGLIPGIHVNLVSATLISLSAIFLNIISIECLVVFIICMALTHTFLDTIPSVFLGAPDSTAISVLPGHKLLLEGKGFSAVSYTIIGSLSGLILGAAIFYFVTVFLEQIYSSIQNYIVYILFFVAFFIIYSSTPKFRTTLLLFCSGILGLIVLNSNLENSLFPLLSGFFGVSTLLFSLKNDSNVLPEQKTIKTLSISLKKIIPSALLGFISGFITSILPGLGSSTAAAISSSITTENEPNTFLVMIGSISTANFFMSIAALHILDKARNGAILAVKELVLSPNVFLLIGVSLIAGGIACIISFPITRWFSKTITKINYKLTVKSVILLICILTFVLSGFKGFVVLVVATIIGLYANEFGIPRRAMMACILFPVISFFLF
ncbi:tripartite tricarboxylate transporter permease [Candidatus Woesearchaeota archaeon]|nr:tripartite tricarboxylate transporter permease [Candidatus Woesearchaeota archaeon]